MRSVHGLRPTTALGGRTPGIFGFGLGFWVRVRVRTRVSVSVSVRVRVRVRTRWSSGIAVAGWQAASVERCDSGRLLQWRAVLPAQETPPAEHSPAWSACMSALVSVRVSGQGQGQD